MKFLVQKIDNKLTLDFCHELVVSRIYAQWRGDDFKIKYVNNLCIPKDIKRPQQYIPVGTVEFVTDYIKTYFPEKKECLIPLNVPDCLRSYAGRYVFNIIDPSDSVDEYNSMRDIVEKCDKIFRKSLYKIKDETNGFTEYNPDDLSNIIGYQVSTEAPEILSEWRVFVYHNKVQQVCYYDGDPLVFPDAHRIKYMVSEYAKDDAPIAYTLDVYVTDSSTYVMECHRFFSCGLYGFADNRVLPYMFSQEWHEMMTLD